MLKILENSSLKLWILVIEGLQGRNKTFPSVWGAKSFFPKTRALNVLCKLAFGFQSLCLPSATLDSDIRYAGVSRAFARGLWTIHGSRVGPLLLLQGHFLDIASCAHAFALGYTMA